MAAAAAAAAAATSASTPTNGNETLDPKQSTLVFLINVLHVYLFLRGFSFQHALIRNNTFINFQEIFLPTRLFGPINLNIFKKE